MDFAKLEGVAFVWVTAFILPAVLSLDDLKHHIAVTPDACSTRLAEAAEMLYPVFEGPYFIAPFSFDEVRKRNLPITKTAIAYGERYRYHPDHIRYAEKMLKQARHRFSSLNSIPTEKVTAEISQKHSIAAAEMQYYTEMLQSLKGTFAYPPGYNMFPKGIEPYLPEGAAGVQVR